MPCDLSLQHTRTGGIQLVLLVLLLSYTTCIATVAAEGTPSQSLRSSQSQRDEGRRVFSEIQHADSRWGVLHGARQFLVGLPLPVEDGLLQRAKAALNKQGGWLSSYIDGSLLCIGPPEAAQAARETPGLKWLGHLQPEKKLSDLWQPLLQLAADGRLETLLQAKHSGDSSIHLSAAETWCVGKECRLSISVHFPLVHNTTAARLEGSGLIHGHHPAEAAVADWSKHLEGLFGTGIRLREDGIDVLAVSVTAGMLQDALQWLTMQPAVHWLAPKAPVRLHNWQGTAISQSAAAAPDAPVPLTDDHGSHPVWAAGLTGQGQIIGAGDSGIDRRNCYFIDPSVDWNGSLRADTASGAMVFDSTMHRKIRLYVELGDDIDNTGHGTHTMGSLLGSPYEISNVKALDYRGMAPDAKVAFVDLADSSGSGIKIPQDLSQRYFPLTYGVGSRVHSDSWGSISQDYDYMASQVDLFTWENQDFLPVFAAGNEGFHGSNAEDGLKTVTSPATSKNCISAGATNTAYQMDAQATSSQYVVFQMSIIQQQSSGSQEIDQYQVMQASFGSSIRSLFGQQYTLSVALPSDGCKAFNNTGNVAGTVVLVLRGSCYFALKAQNAQAAGAKALLVYDDQISDYFVPASDGTITGISIPSGSIPRRTGQLLISSLLAGGKLTISFSEAPQLANAFDSLASFSSKGPTKDGRLGVGLLAPGTLQSAYTDGSNTCALRTMRGTSMATPLIAGSAALVRQYFLSGFYPGGSAAAANQYAPSGALVKAVLLGGAAGMDGFESDTGLPLAPPPSFRQGFGRVDLGRSLPLQGSGPGWNLQIVDLANLTTGQSHQYCLKALGGPLSVTLVWHDYPAAVSARTALVNDLDLTVRAAGLDGFPLLGNGGGVGSGGTFAPDRTNNVEQVSVPNLPPGDVSIEVKAYQVFSTHGAQPYALAVLGKFTGALASASNPASREGSSAQSAICRIVVATITDGPSGLINKTAVRFAFSTASSASGSISFECALTSGDQKNTTAVFSSCQSPLQYADLADGQYQFYVRAQGEEIADSRAFTKDTTPPRTSFNTTQPADDASQVALLSWQAQDTSAVTYQCRLNGSLADTQQPVHGVSPSGDLPGPPLALGHWMPCSTPMQLYWLLPGAWSLEVLSTDAAGNQSPDNLISNWTNILQPGISYARILTGPWGPTANKSAIFSLQVLEQDDRGSLSVVGRPLAECALSAAGSPASTGAWSPCGSAPVYSDLQDGAYTFMARASSTSSDTAHQYAMSNFTVDTSAPSIKIITAPPAISGMPSTHVAFNASKSDASFLCQLTNTDAGNAAASGTGTAPCASPVEWSNLVDGHYSFTVTARDRLGNIAQPKTAAFLVDTTPPAIDNIVCPIATRDSNFTVSFSASDSGSGVNGTKCWLRPKSQAVGGSSSDVRDAEYSWSACSSPASFSSLREGRWLLTLQATDAAGLTRQSRDMEIYVSRTPANATITGGPSRSAASPSTVTFSFVPQVHSSVGAPIASAQCLIQDTAGQPQVSVLGKPGGRANSTGDVNVLLQSMDTPATPSASWNNCSSPMTYKDLRSGNYTFQARMLDMAGNLGNATQLYAFAVDAALPLPGSESAAWFTGWRKWAVIAGAAALGLLLLLGLSGVCCWRTRRGRQAAAHAPQGALFDPYDPATPYRQGAQDERALHAALHRSLAQQRRGGSDTEEHLRSAIAASLEEQRLRLALERSMAEQHSPSRRRSPLPAPREDSDPELRRALQASLEEERLQRCLVNHGDA